MRWLRVISLFAVLLTVSCLRDPEVDRNEPDAPTVSCDRENMTRVTIPVTGKVGKRVPGATYGIILESEDGEKMDASFTDQDLNDDNSFFWKADVEPSTTYMVRSFISNGYGRKFSDGVMISTPGTSTATLTDVSYDKASGLLQASVIDDGGRELEEWGFVFGEMSDIKQLRRKEKIPAKERITLPISVLEIDKPSYFIAYAADTENGVAYSFSAKYLGLNDIYDLKIVPEQENLVLHIGETQKLRAELSPMADLPFNWSSDNEQVATVDSEGIVTGVSEGTCIISASYGELGVEVKVSVNPIMVTSVSFDETEREVYVGEIFTLSPTIIPSNATNPQLEWRSSNTSVAIVDSKGSITPVGEGECTIEANALSGVFCSFTCKVVSEAPVFADEGFRNYIYLNFDTDGNGFLSRREVLQVRRIHYEGKECKTMAGIEWLESLESLWCYSNELTSLDVSHNVALQYLSCGNNQLTSLDVSQNITLNILYCGSNQLTSLDVSHNVALQHLRCGNNQLTGLDVMNNMALQSLSCDNNQLTSLDVSRNPELDFLSCVNMQLTSLDVSNNMAIEYLQCGGNQLTSLDVSRHPKLLTLSCGSNQLTSLDVSNNMALKDLYCDGNQLTSLEVSNNMALHTLWCRFNQLTSLDVSNNMALKTLWCRGNQLTSLDVSRNSELKELDCLSNHLTSLDVSNNMALQSLSCDYNQLTSLDVSNNMALEDLYCESNQLTSLDLRHNESLSSLNCRDNPLIDIWLNNAQSFTTFEYPPSATLHYE